MKIPKPVKEKKKRKVPKPKTQERKLIEEIDLLDSDICLIVNGFKCILCNGRAGFTHHYFHKKTHGSVRFEPDNHCPVCFGCHNFTIHTKGDIETLRDILIMRISQFGFDSLKEKSNYLADRSVGYLKSELVRKQARMIEVAGEYSDSLCMQSTAAAKRLLVVQKKALKDLELGNLNNLPF
jgi:hypothetical protein